jgi:DNA modification methylase
VVEEINISKIAVSKISFDDTNPNILTKEQMKSLKLVMEKFGFLAPVILNKDLQVIDGEHRVRVYQELGKKTIPAYVIDVNTINKKMLRQLMNKLRGEHDKQKDAEEFKLIFEAGKLNEFSNLLAAQTEDFQAILERKFNMGIDNEDEVEELPVNPKSKLGEMYQLDNHLIMCGDATKDLNKLLDGNKPQMLFTDPPYGLGGYAGRSGKFENMVGDDEDVTLFYESLPKDIPERYIWGSWFNIKSINEIPRDVIIWRKNNFGMGRGYRGQYEICLYFGKFNGSDSDVWDVKKDNVVEYRHPTQKPVELARRAILNSSKKSDIVLDCYLGSGSTLIACEQTDRICYGMELDPGYIDVVITRWENHTGKKAKKV